MPILIVVMTKEKNIYNPSIPLDELLVLLYRKKAMSLHNGESVIIPLQIIVIGGNVMLHSSVSECVS